MVIVVEMINQPTQTSKTRQLITTFQQYWLPTLIVVGTLVASAILARNPSPRPMLMLGVLLGGSVGAGLFIKWPELGLLAIIPGALVVAFSVAAGSEYSTLNPVFMLVMMLLGLWIVKMIVRRRLEFVNSRTFWPLYLFVIVNLLSFGFGQLPWYTFSGAPLFPQLGGVMIAVVSVGAYILMAHHIRDQRWLEWITWTFLFLGGLLLLETLFPQQILPLTDRISQPGINGRMEVGLFQRGVPNGSMFWLWLIVHAFSQALFNRHLHPVGRGALGLIVVGALYYNLFPNRGWVSGYGPSLAALVVAFLVGAPQMIVPTIVAGVGVVWWRLRTIINEVVMVGDNAYSLSTRLEAWAIVWKIASINPILGVGPANYYFYSERFPIRGYYVRFNSHSNYIDLIAQTGLLGLACILWFFVEVGRLGFSLIRLVPPGGFAQAYVFGSLGGLAGMVVAAGLGDWVLPFVYNVGFSGMRASILGWLFLGGLVALEQIYRPVDQAANEPSRQ